MPRVVLCYDDVLRSMIMGMYVTYLYWYLYAPSLPSFLSLPPSSQLTLTPLPPVCREREGGRLLRALACAWNDRRRTVVAVSFFLIAPVLTTSDCCRFR